MNDFMLPAAGFEREAMRTAYLCWLRTGDRRLMMLECVRYLAAWDEDDNHYLNRGIVALAKSIVVEVDR